MNRVSSYFVIASLALHLVGCGDDGRPPPYEWPKPDGSTDGGGQPDGGEPDGGDPVEASCTVGADFLLGEPEVTAMEVDRVQVVARPGTSDQFVLVTAQEFCPTPPCDGNVGGEGMGSEDWRRRRALLYTFDGGSAPSAPSMVNLGVGQNQLTTTRSPALAPVGARLVVAWLDSGDATDGNTIDVWTQSVAASTLAPGGTMVRASNVTKSARRLVLVPGASSATALYEDFQQGSPPALHAVDISSEGAPGASVSHGPIPASSDSHAGIRLSNGEVLFGRTEPTTGSECDFLVGDPSEPDAALPVQEDPATHACFEVALAPGAAAFAATKSGARVVQFRPLSAGGEPIGREVTLAGSHGAPAGQPAIAKFANGYFAAYVRYGEPHSLRGAIVTSTGAVQQDVELVGDLGSAFANPSVAVSNDGSVIAVAWKERSHTNHLETRAVRLSCN